MFMEDKKISVLGLGYIGLPTAILLASKYSEVIGVDVNEDLVRSINKNEHSIEEDGFNDLLNKAISEGKFRAYNKPKTADVFLIAVPTPFYKVDDNVCADLTYVKSACSEISKVLKKGDLVILESTSSVGTTEEIADLFSKLRPDLIFPKRNNDQCDINIAYCPERVIPGNIRNELVNNDRVVGGLSNDCSNKARTFYKSFVDAEVYLTDSKTAEMTKLVENASRDSQIAFANELSIICDDLGINAWELITLANKHPRVNILNPGSGVGGHCIAVDPWFIVSKSPSTANFIKSARITNDNKTKWVAKKVISTIKKLSATQNIHESKIKISIYGLAYKPDIDDMRESPSIKIIEILQEELDSSLVINEPNIDKLDSKYGFDNIDFKTASNSDVHVFLVAHSYYTDKPRPKGILLDIAGVWK